VKILLRIVAAILVLIGGLLHYRIWDDRYRDIPDGALPGLNVVKVGFPVNAGVSVLLAILLIVFGRRPIVWLVTLLFEVGSIVALVLSRQASIFGWEEKGWDSDAKQVLLVEVLAVVLLGLLLTFDFLRSGSGSGSDSDTDTDTA